VLTVGRYETPARAYIGRFNFKGGDQQKRVGQLSGGERGRLHMAKTLIAGGNVLLLDEPSNDLDVETLRALEDALLEFAGSVLVISHDRWFLDRICTHILACEGDSQWTFFSGNYHEYEEDKKRRLGEEAAKPKRIRYKPITRAVGVDIGCGMIATRTTLKASDLPDSLHPLRSAIEQAIPHGRTVGRGKRDEGSWQNPPERVSALWAELLPGFTRIVEKYPHLRDTNNHKHLGTLGTGNHFIEVCLDEADHVWFMLHSGSRGVGNAIGSTFIALAQADMRQHLANLPDRDLAYIEEGSVHFDDYLEAVGWAQNYARRNRTAMMDSLIAVARKVITRPFTVNVEAVNCHHNYVQKETHFGSEIFVTRKGALSARKGELGIIPGSMGAQKLYRSRPRQRESFCSCSHGAGRDEPQRGQGALHARRPRKAPPPARRVPQGQGGDRRDRRWRTRTSTR
jgi:hypothetical protein